MKRATLLLLLLCCACSPSQPEDDTLESKPAIRYCIEDGAPVWKAPYQQGAEPVRVMKYGERIAAVCQKAACVFREGASEFEVPLTSTSIIAPPGPTLFVIGTAAIYDSPDSIKIIGRLRDGSRVKAKRFRPLLGDRDRTRVQIGKDRWVKAFNLRETPETAKERQARRAAEARDAQQQREASRAQATAAASGRRMYAESLHNHFLDQGLDVKVNVSGTNADRLTLRFVLFNDVWSRKMETEGTLLREIHAQGFKRLDMTNGYDWHVYWTWK